MTDWHIYINKLKRLVDLSTPDNNPNLSKNYSQVKRSEHSYMYLVCLFEIEKM